MNRELKFRGKELGTGKWVYGDLLHPITSCRIVNYTETEENGALRADYHCHDIDPNTIGQFTNLRDCNGKDIYEGDIVADYSSSPFPFVVEWDNECGEYIVDCPITHECKSLCQVMDYTEIVGNIHDNSDLIKWK